MTDEQHASWIKLAILIALIAAATVCAITGHETAAEWFAVPIVWMFLGVL